MWPNGDTYLHFAAEYGRIEMAGHLLDKGMDVNVVNHGGKTPLDIASFGGHAEMAEFLVSRGAQPGGDEPVSGEPPQRDADDIPESSAAGKDRPPREM